MITSNNSRLTLGRIALIATGCTACFAVVHLSNAVPAEKPAMTAPADEARKLPLTPTFEKKSGDQEGPQYVLTLKNESKEALQASAEIFYSVVVHNRPKSRDLPEQSIAAGATWTIPELASMDKVVVKAKGYAPLEVVVP